MKIIINPDADTTAILKALKRNGGYCPCKFPISKETKCRCEEFKAQKEPGPCHCGLYVKVKEEADEPNK